MIVNGYSAGVYKMFGKLLTILTLSTCIVVQSSIASESDVQLQRMHWPFDGMFGTVDRQAAQRGFQVYKEVCSVCHGLNQLSYRNLQDLGFSPEEIAAIAESVTVQDGPNDQGNMFERPGKPSDTFVNPYPNEQAARAANNGAFPPDLSLIIKAREGGADYLHSLLIGFENPPADFKMMPGLSYNKYFPGHQIAMPSPLSDGQVQYTDGTVATVDQMSHDVAIFLQWAAEPEMEHRKSMGLKSIIFLAILTIVCYVAKQRIWARLK